MELRVGVGGEELGRGEVFISRRDAEKQRAQRAVATKSTKSTKMILELGRADACAPFGFCCRRICPSKQSFFGAFPQSPKDAESILD